MRQLLILTFITFITFNAFSQVDSTLKTFLNQNAAGRVMDNGSNNHLTFGAYAQLDYNQPLVNNTKSNGVLDVHRLVLLMGYQFNSKTSFITEIEFEHVKEVSIEQAFLNYNLHRYVNFRAGLMLIPMGIVNEYHEPVTFNGVERPNLDGKIIPSTWREMGVGFSGKFDNLSLRYQIYAVNGFLSYAKGNGKLRGIDGFRKGRQKGAESIMSSPNFTGKIDYYGIQGLKIGLSTYLGNTQSDLYHGITTSDAIAVGSADSSVVGLKMIGVNYRYYHRGFQSRAEFIYANISGTNAYNAFASSDLGASMLGYYFEAGYDVLRLIKKSDKQVVLFGRFEKYNTQNSVDGISKNLAYDRTDITLGVTYKLNRGTVLKGDYQIFKNAGNINEHEQLNFGIGIWF